MAEPFMYRGRWHLRINTHDRGWVNLPISARSKTEAKRFGVELQLKEERIRQGLETPPQKNSDETFGEMVQRWIDAYLANSRSYSRSLGTVRRLLRSELAPLTPGQVTPGKVLSFLNGQQSQVGPRTVNHLRMFIRRIFTAAKQVERFFGPNPVDGDKVPKKAVPKRKPTYLKENQVLAVLFHVPPRWRAAFATGVYAGLRKGEIFGLRKADLDLEQRLIHVRRSHGADTTKGGHEDVIPMPSELVPHLRQAMDESPSPLVFPRRMAPPGRRAPISCPSSGRPSVAPASSPATCTSAGGKRGATRSRPRTPPSAAARGAT
jgi:integrase